MYGNGEVFTDFERFVAAFIGQPNWFTLLHNSGTNAIYALYFAASIQPGDEVIVPAYTLNATCSSMMQLVAVPIFCDLLPNGTIDPKQIESRIGSRTKAVMVSPMWEYPVKCIEFTRYVILMVLFYWRIARTLVVGLFRARWWAHSEMEPSGACRVKS
jgi:dTDP-4-amino-4,6-dideoxygalactose transaminase